VALEYFKTQVLLLHSQQSTLDALSSGFNDRYSVHCATSGSEALSTLGATPIHVIVSAQELPGMSGLEALREAKKRSPETIGILLAGRDQSDGLEALVGDKEVFQIVRGEISPEALRNLIDTATKRARLIALSESANDNAANVDEPMGEHIVMETSENGSAIISDGTGSMPALKPQKIEIGADTGSRGVDILVLTKDEEFLATVKESSRGLHKVHHAVTPSQAEGFFKGNKIGVLVTDAAMVGSNIEVLTHKLRSFVPRLVAIVAGRRDDGELLMDLINRGQVYRFLLKPVSPGRARLAIEASVKHHLEAADSAFKPGAAKSQPAPVVKTAPAGKPAPKAPPVAAAPPPRKAPAAAAPQRRTPTISATPITATRMDDRLDDAFGDESSFTETMTGIAVTIGKSLSGVGKKTQDSLPKIKNADRATPIPGRLAALLTPKGMAAAAGLVVILIVGMWLWPDADDAVVPAPPDRDVPEASASRGMPRVVESELPSQPDAVDTQNALPAYADLLDEARIARDAGEIFTPAGSNAIELYIAARKAAPDDAVIADEMVDLVNQVLGMAEAALLARKPADAEAAISMARLAAPDNPRLAFLDAQLAQLKYRGLLDDARAAIRTQRFEDAAAQLATAKSIAGVDLSEVRLLSQELAKAKSEQKIDEVLTLAATRLDEDKLTNPSNDNARYYYELALGRDPGNTAAQQGLVIVASKLVLKARAAIDNDQLDQADGLLRDAKALDPANGELAAATAALQNSRQLKADAEQQALAARQAEIEKQAAAERQAEADRLAELRRQEEARRQAAAAIPASTGATAATDPAAISGSAKSLANTDQPGSAPATMGRAPNNAATDNGETALAAAARKVAQSDETTVPETPVKSAPAGPRLTELVGVSTLNRTRYVSPKYPRNAMRREITGYVDVSFTVARDGSVRDVSVQDAKPKKTFDDAAIEAVLQWRFDPVIENGVAVEKRTAVRMAFEIQ
jgi:serine/threonine-protein kinase